MTGKMPGPAKPGAIMLLTHPADLFLFKQSGPLTRTLVMRTPLIAALSLIAAGLVSAVEPIPVAAPDPRSKPVCEDNISSAATIVPKLDSPLFHETKSSLNWWIIESAPGVLEDTIDGEIGADDLVRIEHTASCFSTHQGRHAMEFCNAIQEGAKIQLSLSGGLPACVGGLDVTLEPDLKFRCAFSVVYPGPTGPLRWKITQKELRLKSRDLSARHRLYGWISVTFEEADDSGAPPRTYKIEGYFKPVIQNHPR